MLQQLKQSQFQIQQSTLLAMTLGELETAVRDELNDNPALMKSSDDSIDHSDEDIDRDDTAVDHDDDQTIDYDTSDAPDLTETTDSDIMEVYGSHQAERYDAEAQESLFGDTQSLRDRLREQTIELDLDEKERYVVNYLIDSIDDDGLLRESLDSIADTLAIYHGIDISTTELETLLQQIQRLDPPGVGARSLKECLWIQVKRMKSSPLQQALSDLIENHYDDICQNNWQRIREQMNLDLDDAIALQKELRRLNPHPGRALGESGSAKLQQIVPDFIVDVDDRGKVSFTMNKGHIPQLSIADSFVEIIEKSKQSGRKLTSREQEALVYARQKVQAGRSFIFAIERRWQMLHDAMQAIIDIQHQYFVDGDESSLVTMTLKDVADRMGVSLSSISRVNNEKYVETPWGTFPLKHFFSQSSSVGEEGKSVSHTTVLETLKDIISNEDKSNPYIDDELVDMMKKRGFECSRRTISKYRSLLGIPTAKMRRGQE